MTNEPGKRTDAASRFIKASPKTIYRAFVEPASLIAWLPPAGMTGRVHAFEPKSGGVYHLTLTYENKDHAGSGKTSGNTDVVRGRFLELVPDERIVQVGEFDTDDPAFAGTMKMTWTLTAAPGGTEVRILCENVPEGIRPEDHDAGLRSTLANLAAFTETE